ncbi:hypothetical protein LXL04_020371 [Taraxacum kok-saghyz]
MEPSSSTTSQITATGSNPAKMSSSTEASKSDTPVVVRNAIGIVLLPWVAVFMWLDGFAPLLEVAFCLFCALLQLHCAAVVRMGVFKFAAASESKKGIPMMPIAEAPMTPLYELRNSLRSITYGIRYGILWLWNQVHSKRATELATDKELWNLLWTNSYGNSYGVLPMECATEYIGYGIKSVANSSVAKSLFYCSAGIEWVGDGGVRLKRERERERVRESELGSFENSYIPENPRTPPISYISQTVIHFKKPISVFERFLNKNLKYVYTQKKFFCTYAKFLKKKFRFFGNFFCDRACI